MAPYGTDRLEKKSHVSRLSAERRTDTRSSFPGARPSVSNTFWRMKEDDIQVFERAKCTNARTLGWSAGTICMPDEPYGDKRGIHQYHQTAE